MMGEPYLNDVPIKEAFPKAEHWSVVSPEVVVRFRSYGKQLGDGSAECIGHLLCCCRICGTPPLDSRNGLLCHIDLLGKFRQRPASLEACGLNSLDFSLYHVLLLSSDFGEEQKKPPSGRSSPLSGIESSAQRRRVFLVGHLLPDIAARWWGLAVSELWARFFYSPAVVSAFCLPAGRPPAFMFGPFKPELMVAQSFDAVN